jgi:putative tryptophan/tyrosine transport system substrate-binding protein
MRRREFLFGLSSAAMLCSAAWGQRRTPVVGFLSATSVEAYAPFLASFLSGLGEAGFVDGTNVRIDYRWSNYNDAQLPALAADLVRNAVAVIVASGGDVAPRAAKGATTTIPITFTSGGDPVAAGLVKSLNRPDGNATGVSVFASQLGSKRMQLVRDLNPEAKVVGFLVNPGNPNAPHEIGDMTSAANALGLRLIVRTAHTEKDCDEAFKALARELASAVVIASDPFFNALRTRLVALPERYSLQTIFPRREFAEAGGLMSYGNSLSEAYRQLGVYAGRILKGENPGELPVVQPTKFELVINLKTAKALSLTIPPTLLARADEVIE